MPSQYGIGKKGSSFEVSLPSGNMCLVRSIGTEDIISAGLLDKFDSLTGAVQTQHIDRVATGKNPPRLSTQSEEAQAEAQAREIAKDPSKFLDIVAVADKIVVLALIDPVVHMPPTDGSPRITDKLYIDEIELSDKMAVFQAVMQPIVGKVRSMEPFRVPGNVDGPGMGNGQGVQNTPEPAARSEHGVHGEFLF